MAGGITLTFTLFIVGVWLVAALLICGGFVHRRFGVADDLRAAGEQCGAPSNAQQATCETHTAERRRWV